MGGTLIERAARAAYESHQKTDTIPHVPAWADLPDATKRKFIDAQRAAMQAIREPTEAMLDTARWPIQFSEDVEADEERRQFRAAWQKAIDVALSEAPTPATSPAPRKG